MTVFHQWRHHTSAVPLGWLRMDPPRKILGKCVPPQFGPCPPHEFPKFSKFSVLVSSPPHIPPPRKISQSVPVQNFSTCRGMKRTMIHEIKACKNHGLEFQSFSTANCLGFIFRVIKLRLWLFWRLHFAHFDLFTITHSGNAENEPRRNLNRYVSRNLPWQYYRSEIQRRASD